MSARDAEKAFHKHLKERAFEPAYLVTGEDEYRKDAAVRELIAAAVDPATADFNLDIRAAKELDGDTIASLLGMPPMMADRRVVVIKDVAALRKAARQALDRALQSPSPDCIVVLVAAAGAKADAALSKAAFTLDLGALSGDRVPKFLQHTAAQAGAAGITDEAIILLVERVEIVTEGLNVRLRMDGLAGLAREITADIGAAA